MTTQKEAEMLEKVLNLPGVIIKGYKKIQGVGWTFRVESESQEKICPRCGGTSRKLHQNHWYLVKDLPICINEELDNQRKRQRKEVNKIKNKEEKEQKLKAITKSKYVLLKNYIELKPEEKEKLKEVQKHFPILKKMYSQKERLRLIYEKTNNWQEGIFKIGNWLKRVKNLFPKSSQTIKNWIGENSDNDVH